MKMRVLCLSLALSSLLVSCMPLSITENSDESTQLNDPSTSGSTSENRPASLVSADLIAPESLRYLGAFRLPGGEDPPLTFAYGGNAMTFNPSGDPSGASDGFPGSLFVMGFDRVAYGEFPDGSQVAEVNIPQPLVAGNIEELNSAEFIAGFSNVADGYFTELEEIPKIGMQYLDHPATGPLIHIAWGAHIQPQDAPSHAWFSADLTSPSMQGFWFIGNQDLYSVNGYMFEIPADWADLYTNGKVIATGRMRDGGQGGMGPTIFAYKPWADDGNPPPMGARLEEVTLLLYENAYNTTEIMHAMNGYQHADEWEGGAWLTSNSDRSAVVFAGTKANGEKSWYGYMHPDGPQKVCVDVHISDFPTCRLADGGFCDPVDMGGCCDEQSGSCVSNRGWWSNRFDAQIIFYDPADLARVAIGEMEPWQPQPYGYLDIDEYLFLQPPVWDEVNVGIGDQRRYRIGDITFDRQNGLLYILELYADSAKPVVHVWSLD